MINDLPPATATPAVTSNQEQKPAQSAQESHDVIRNILDKVDLSAASLDGFSEQIPAFLSHLTDWLNPVSSAPSPGTSPAATAGPSSLGLRARDYGRDGGARNPASGDDNWYMSCLGWTNQAFRSEGKVIPELQAADAKSAFRQAEANGKIHYGSPPPGAIVFYPEMSQWGHVGIVNEDGTTYRGTVPRSESRTTLGDRPIPNADRVAWMLPE
ncbi:MAG: CHAP domain-containing protein [Vulcanimicrobiota bacterium]